MKIARLCQNHIIHSETVMLFRRRARKVSLQDKLVKAQKGRLSPLPDAQMSADDRASCIIAIVQDQPDWDYAMDNHKASENAIYAAAYYGIVGPFSDEQTKLHQFLIDNLAGRQIAIYAWGVYKDIVG